MYEFGEGVGEDFTKAFQWYRKAAEQGHAEAQYSLGFMFEFGEGVAKDLNQARYWYKLAADNGNADAKAKLESLPK